MDRPPQLLGGPVGVLQGQGGQTRESTGIAVRDFGEDVVGNPGVVDGDGCLGLHLDTGRC